MRARRIGRLLGIGVRVATRVVSGRVPGQSIPLERQFGPSRTPRDSVVAVAGPQNQGRVAVSQSCAALPPTRSVSHGVGGLLRPFRRIGGILWLEVTGAFFLLPVVVFAPTLWREIVAYRYTTDHKTLWLTAAIMAVFLYLGLSSFWRAQRRSLRS